MTAWTVRPIEADEHAAWRALPYRNFHVDKRPMDSDLDFLRRRYATQHLTAAYDGDTIVGTFRTWDIDLPVPGGTVAAEAVSSVTVSPTHRRRGVLTAMMTSSLRAARERGRSVSILIASGAEIYGRYGYAVATEHCTWTLDASKPFREDNLSGLDFQLCSDSDLVEVAPQVYARAAAGMPGAMPRDELTWAQILGVSGLSHEDKTTARPAVVARVDGEAVGYARYHVKESSQQRVDTSVLHLDDLAATTPAAYAGLWQFVASIDLVATVEAGDRPVHEPLPWLLRDRRAARQSELADFQWVALLDVGAALAARSYDVAGGCVVEIAGEGRWSLEADGRESAVQQTTASAEVTMPLRSLASAYLGQISVTQLHAAGLVTEHRPGAVRRLDALLTHRPETAIGHTWF
jgi:predicted acetyltransferase